MRDVEDDIMDDDPTVSRLDKVVITVDDAILCCNAVVCCSDREVDTRSEVVTRIEVEGPRMGPSLCWIGVEDIGG